MTRRRKGEHHPRAKLTPAAIHEARLAWAHGTPQTEIARRLSVAQSTVSRILNGKRWTHLKA